MQRDGSLSYGTLALQEGRSVDDRTATWIWLVELWIRFRISGVDSALRNGFTALYLTWLTCDHCWCGISVWNATS